MADGRSATSSLFARQGGVGATAGDAAEIGRCSVAWSGQSTRVPCDAEKNDWQESQGADLRVSAAESRNTALVHDAGNSRAAGLRTDGDYIDLHHGRSEPRRSGARGTGNSRHGDEAG